MPITCQYTQPLEWEGQWWTWRRWSSWWWCWKHRQQNRPVSASMLCHAHVESWMLNTELYTKTDHLLFLIKEDIWKHLEYNENKVVSHLSRGEQLQLYKEKEQQKVTITWASSPFLSSLLLLLLIYIRFELIKPESQRDVNWNSWIFSLTVSLVPLSTLSNAKVSVKIDLIRWGFSPKLRKIKMLEDIVRRLRFDK